MPRKIDDAESDAVLLRTTADILSGALTQLECCAKRWRTYESGAITFRKFVERMVEDAKEYGYIEKRGRV